MMISSRSHCCCFYLTTDASLPAGVACVGRRWQADAPTAANPGSTRLVQMTDNVPHFQSQEPGQRTSQRELERNASRIREEKFTRKQATAFGSLTYSEISEDSEILEASCDFYSMSAA
jgi:hypothetical protein